MNAAQGYMFDLDGHEQGGGKRSDDVDEEDPQYSVNSYACGSCLTLPSNHPVRLTGIYDGRELDTVYQVSVICVVHGVHGQCAFHFSHSCEPNTCVYSVTYDTPSEVGLCFQSPWAGPNIISGQSAIPCFRRNA